MEKISNTINIIFNNKYFLFLFWICLIMIGVFVLYYRYPFAYTAPNFYGEDGNIIFENIYNSGIISSLFTRFNGYFILLQYLLGYMALIINNAIGGELYTLPKVVALVSYAFFSFACTLPWLLFRNKIGQTITLVLFALLLFTPLGRSDFAVLGTLGNLKFLIFYIAFIFIVYRNDKQLVSDHSYKIYLVDIVLLLCAFTNILVVAILPLALLRYKKNIYTLFRKSKNEFNKIFKNKGFISLLTLIFVLLIYISWMYILGIPKMPGYLDGPLIISGLVNSIFRSSWYGIIYPAYTTMNIIVVICLLILIPMTLFIKKNKDIYISVIWSIIVASLGFTFNRPGVTEFLRTYNPDGGPGQFFYGGTMIFMFGIIYLFHNKFNSCNKSYKALILFVIFIYFAWAIPYAGEKSKSYAIYSNRPTSYQSLVNSCTTATGDNVIFKIYPLEGWDMKMKREIACRGI